ncbi:MAG: hypothetical protein ACLR0I_08355 [Streptococcus salivarius]
MVIAVSGLALGASLIGVGVSADEQLQVTSTSTQGSVSQILILSSQNSFDMTKLIKSQ